MPRKPRQKPAATIPQIETPPHPQIVVSEPSVEQGNTDNPLTELYIAEYTGDRTPPERKATIYSCADHLKMSVQEIASRLSMDYRTVRAVLAARDNTAIDARNLLAANALQFTQDWLEASRQGSKKGKHGPAKDALLHLKVIEPVQDSQPVVQVAIVVGKPRDTSLLNPPQAIDIKTLTDSGKDT